MNKSNQNNNENLIKASLGKNAVLSTSFVSNKDFSIYDQGLANISVCKSSITYMDSSGTMLHRGYPLGELVEKSNYLKTAYLLIYGELPSDTEFYEFSKGVKEQFELSKEFIDFMNSLPKSENSNSQRTMGFLAMCMNAIPLFYPQVNNDPSYAIKVILGKIPLIIAFNSNGEYFKKEINLNCDNDALADEQIRANSASCASGASRANAANSASCASDANVSNCVSAKTEQKCFSFSKTLLKSIFGKAKNLTELDILATDRLLMLHSDLSQNCSTMALRTVQSSGGSLFSAMAAAINALSGAKHGGANEAVLNQLIFVQKNNISVKDFVENSLKEKKPIFGFGHRIFRTYDARTVFIREFAQELAKQEQAKKEDKQLLEIALNLEQEVINNSYFKQRKIFTNVDMFTSIVYRFLGFKRSVYPNLFALGRLPGWIAHFNEASKDKSTRIVHPQQVYTGPLTRHIE